MAPRALVLIVRGLEVGVGVPPLDLDSLPGPLDGESEGEGGGESVAVSMC